MFSHVFVGVSDFERAMAFYRPEYHPHYYGVYFRDLDGNKLGEACHREE